MVDAIVACLPARQLRFRRMDTTQLCVAKIPRGLLVVVLIGRSESLSLRASWALAVLPGGASGIDQILSLCAAHSNHRAGSGTFQSLSDYLGTLQS